MRARKVGHWGMWNRTGFRRLEEATVRSGQSLFLYIKSRCVTYNPGLSVMNNLWLSQSCLHFLLSSIFITFCFALMFPHLWAHWEDQALRSEIIVKMAVLCRGTHGVQRGKMQGIHDQIWVMSFLLSLHNEVSVRDLKPQWFRHLNRNEK